MRQLGVILLAAIVPVWANGRDESVESLQASLRILSGRVVLGEDVLLELELRNVSKAPFSVIGFVSAGSRYGLGELEFLVYDGNGTSFDVRDDDIIVDGVASPQSYVKLEAGASQKIPLAMSPEYYVGSVGQSGMRSLKTFEPGRYEVSVQVTLQRPSWKIDESIWAGTVRSNSVVFEVVSAE